MYEAEIIIFLIIGGVVQLVINIILIVKLLQSAKNIKLLADFFIKGEKPLYDPELDMFYPYNKLYYKIGDNISQGEWKAQYKKAINDIDNETEKEREEKEKALKDKLGVEGYERYKAQEGAQKYPMFH